MHSKSGIGIFREQQIAIMKDAWFRIWMYVRHQFRSWNTGGEGIHSPYLFYLVRMLIYDENRYYSWRDIEQQRRALLRSDKEIEVTDYGTGKDRKSGRKVREISKHCLGLPLEGEVMYRLIAYMRHELKRPLRIVELGTCFGITTSYLAMADSRNEVETYEGSEAIAAIAKDVWRKLGVRNIRLVPGNIDETLYKRAYAKRAREARENRAIDFAFIDANHTKEATLRYFDELSREKTESSVFILDDIYYSRGMAEAWREICAREDVTTTMDFYHFGMVFFDPHYLKRHYRLRI